MHLDDVARGARLLRDDRHVAPGERVEQARLAGIGRAGDDDAEAVAQALAAVPSARWRAIDSRSALDDGAGLDRDVGRHVAFVGEVEPGLDQRLRAEQLRAPALVELPQRAFRLRSAWRRCASVSASIRSARPSTSVRSSLPFSKARRANSPGSARRHAGEARAAHRARRGSPRGRHAAGARPCPRR